MPDLFTLTVHCEACKRLPFTLYSQIYITTRYSCYIFIVFIFVPVFCKVYIL